MIIYPTEHLGTTFASAVAGFNRSPRAGDAGHTDDHARLSAVLFDVPNTQSAALGSAGKYDGVWYLSDGPGTPSESTWAAVKEFLDRPGVSCVADDPHDAADGVTDWDADSADLDDITVTVFTAGVVGLVHAFDALTPIFADFSDRLTALEQA